ncbi:MAG: adenosylmethionine decarboxylase [Richelia sp.]|nr:adenosylmethionine decarboxylase [Richelia sp.]
MENQSYPVGETSLVPVGTHCILELYECPTDLLNNLVFIRDSLQEAAKRAKSTLLKEITHQFHPYGVTALVLLAESHISIHTWPETGYIAVDIFTCGQHTEPEKACKFLLEAFQASNHVILNFPRGRLTPQLQELQAKFLLETPSYR